MSLQDPIAINYSRAFGWSGSLLAELCAAPATSAVALSFNFDGGSEIGFYQLALGDGAFRASLARLRRSRYELLPEPSGPFPPETCFVNIGERRVGDALPTMRHFDVAALPAEIAQLRDDFEAGFIARVRTVPVRVLSATASWQTPVFDPREPLVANVKLECRGTLPIVVSNPLAASRRWSGLSLAIRSTSEWQGTVTLKAMHLRAAPGAPDDDQATLVPGAHLTFAIKKRVYLPPGVYQAMLSYRSDANQGDPQAVNGEVWIDLGQVTIAAPSRP